MIFLDADIVLIELRYRRDPKAALNRQALQQIKADPDAVPIATREFSRTDRLILRVPVYGPGGTTPAVSVHLLNRSGGAMNELPASPSAAAGIQEIDVPLAALAPGEYVIEIKATGNGGEAKELVGFRVTS